MSMLNDQFRVRRSVGQTLYGAVWLCEDTTRTNELVAVKEVSLHVAKQALTAAHGKLDNPFVERRVARDLETLAVHHANILRFRTEFIEQGKWYMVSEYCEGGDLLRRLEDEQQNRLSESKALHYFRQIVEGVHFLHSNGIAHRDLSLENVLLKNDVCKICDFGLATEANRICTERVGKAYYMAPEIVAEECYDPMAADMWSLGIMLFILLTGSPLVQSASRDEKAFLALENFGVARILELWKLDKCVSPATTELLTRLLKVAPAERPSAIEVLAHNAINRP